MYRLDLHTHSDASNDGGLTLGDYRRALKTLDYIAVTDHNTLAGAKAIHKALGARIIIGCEISTAHGDLIGLFLSQDIPPGLTLKQTINRIRAQNGLVMVPHPFERWQRASLSQAQLAGVLKDLDIIETYNGRSLSLRGRFKARRFARRHNLAAISNSDAHGPAGIGRTYTMVKHPPTASNLVEQLRGASYINAQTPLKGLFEPSRNRRGKMSQKKGSANG